MIEGQRRKINKETEPNKDIITVKEREHEVLNSVPIVYRESLEKVIQKYRDVFLKNYPREYHPIGRYNIVLRSNRIVIPLSVSLPVGSCRTG